MFPSWDELTPLEQRASTYSDCYKEAHGIRPRHSTKGWTVEQFDGEIANLLTIIEENIVRENEAQAVAAVEFEAKIASLIQLGANDRENAIRWLGDDRSFIEYEWGLRYGYLARDVAA